MSNSQATPVQHFLLTISSLAASTRSGSRCHSFHELSQQQDDEQAEDEEYEQTPHRPEDRRQLWRAAVANTMAGRGGSTRPKRKVRRGVKTNFIFKLNNLLGSPGTPVTGLLPGAESHSMLVCGVSRIN